MTVRPSGSDIDPACSNLVDVDLPALRTRLVESRNRIATAAGIPLDGTWRLRPEPE